MASQDKATPICVSPAFPRIPQPLSHPLPALSSKVAVTLSAVYNGRELNLDLTQSSLDVYSYTAFKSKIQDTFQIRDVKMTYVDDANDTVCVDSEEEFREALKVGQQLRFLQFNVTGKEFNRYVAHLQLRLSRQTHSEPMESDEFSSPENSFVKVSHSDVPMEIKYPPSSQHSPSGHHYSDLAHMLGSERKQPRSTPNKYVKMLQLKFNKGTPTSPRVFQKVTSPAQTLSRSPVVSHSPMNLREKFQASGALKLSPRKPHLAPVTSPRNKYVKELYAKLQQMPTSVPADVPENKYVNEVASKLKQKPRNRARHDKEHQKKREWFNSALKQESQVIVEEFQKGLNNVVTILSESNSPAVHRQIVPQPFGIGPVHESVICDACQNTIIGVRYKCGNCADYDLCEWCEPSSDTVHQADHIFLKIKTPGRRVGWNCKGKPKSLLRKNIYLHHCHDPCSSSDEESHMAIKRHKKMEKEKHRHHHHHRREHRMDEAPLTTAPNEFTNITGGYVTKPRPLLWDNLTELKKRKREERMQAKVEAKIDKLETKLASVSVGEEGIVKKVKVEKEKHKQKGHGKYLDGEFIVDTSYPDESVVPFQMPFEKGWIVMNSGTKKWKHVKLVFQDGYQPVTSQINVPELKPGERVELVAQYPAVCDKILPFVQSCWRFVHKETTAFGPLLWVSIHVANQESITTPPVTPFLPKAPLTNENLLKSIGFIPGDSESSKEDMSGSAPCPDHTDPDHTGPDNTDQPSTSFQILEQPDFLEMPSGCDPLLQTFDVVDTPKSFVSLSSIDSFQQVSADITDMGDDVETASTCSAESDDFVVIIPDCFDVSKPLPGYTLPVIEPEVHTPPHLTSLISDVMKSHENLMTSSMRSQESEVRCKPDATDPSEADQFVSVTEPSPQMARKDFVPRRYTLKNVKDARMYTNPITLATGFFNTVSDLVSERVKIGQVEKMSGNPITSEPQARVSEDEEEYEDALEVPTVTSTEITPTAPPHQAWKSQQLSDVSTLLPNNQDICPWLNPSQDDSKWCHSPDVSHLLPLRWDGPKPPATPMEKLISMGFADRTVNQQLLDKHNNNMPMVLNELLDGHYNGSSSETVFI